MRKSTKILLGIFCAGILCAGIGIGAAFVEFSSMEYVGNYFMPEDAVKEKTFELVVDPAEQSLLRLGNSPREMAAIVYSSDIPENTIRWTVTYNENVYEPELFVQNYHSNGEIWKYMDVYFNYREGISDFSLFMSLKDQVMKDLKQRKISSYDLGGGYTVSIVVSESLAGYMREGDGIVCDDIYLDDNDGSSSEDNNQEGTIDDVSENESGTNLENAVDEPEDGDVQEN